MKRVMVAASLTVLAAGLTACGGGSGSGAPTDASKADFCGAYTSVFADFASAGEDTDALATAMKDWGKEMAKVGTPEGISEDARKGFEVSVEQLENIKADDLEGLAGGQLPQVEVSESDQKAATEFTTYVTTECSAEIQEAASELAGSMTE